MRTYYHGKRRSRQIGLQAGMWGERSAKRRERMERGSDEVERNKEERAAVREGAS